MADNAPTRINAIVRKSLRFYKLAEVYIVCLILVGFLILQVAAIKKPLEKRTDLAWVTLAVILPLVLIVLVRQVAEVARRLEGVERGIQVVSGSIEAAVLDRILKIKDPKQQQLHVVGINLRYGWPDLRRWISEKRLNSWEVAVAGFCPTDPSSWIPEDWHGDVARTSLEGAIEYSNDPKVVAREVQLSVYAYDHLPAVHGYQLGNGDLFVARVSWNKEGTALSGAINYEFVPKGAKSRSATAMRLNFRSWVAASCSERNRMQA